MPSAVDIEELKSTIDRMRTAADVFHSLSMRTGHHRFGSLPGLVYEYIELCQQQLDAGINFKEVKTTVLSPSRCRYIKQKLVDLFGYELLG